MTFWIPVLECRLLSASPKGSIHMSSATVTHTCAAKGKPAKQLKGHALQLNSPTKSFQIKRWLIPVAVLSNELCEAS